MSDTFFDRFVLWVHRVHPEVVLTDYQRDVAKQMLAHSSVSAIQSRRQSKSLITNLLIDYVNGEDGPVVRNLNAIGRANDRARR